VTVGHKIALKLEGDPRVIASIDGPNSVEEIPRVISELSEKLVPMATSRWLFIHNDGGESDLRTDVTFPLEPRLARQAPQFSYSPTLNMRPELLFPKLLEQYLTSVMYKIFYASFMAENRERLRHMDGALRKLENDLDRLTLKLNASRQEEITEELEVILLNAKSMTRV
jgi:F-type H+-transporting ATPase subunit gamma